MFQFHRWCKNVSPTDIFWMSGWFLFRFPHIVTVIQQWQVPFMTIWAHGYRRESLVSLSPPSSLCLPAFLFLARNVCLTSCLPACSFSVFLLHSLKQLVAWRKKLYPSFMLFILYFPHTYHPDHLYATAFKRERNKKMVWKSTSWILGKFHWLQ